MGQNLYNLLISENAGDLVRVCLETPDGRSFTFAEVDEHSAQIANLLASRGVAAGDRVAVQVEKSPEAVFLYLACLRAGAIYLPLNTAYTQEETAYFLADAQPRAMICPRLTRSPRFTSSAALCA
jgi:malonyl-CoA/methylmalonyl-CoA synthetase